METVVQILLVIFVLSTLLLVRKPIRLSPTKVEFSIWTKLFAINGGGLIALMIGVMYFENRVTNFNSVYSIVSVLMLFYLIYFLMAFKAYYQGHAFSWFNGLWIRSIDTSELKEVLLTKRNKKTKQIELATNNSKIKVSRFFERVILNFAKENKIKTSYVEIE